MTSRAGGLLSWTRRFCLGVLSLVSTIDAASAQTIEVSTRAELINAVRRAIPGTTILIAPGTYEGGLYFDKVQGTEDGPITIAAAERDRPPVFKGRRTSFQLTDPAFVELRDLIFSGAIDNGLNIDDGGSYDTPARHVTLKRLTIRDIGPEGNRDGIKLSGVDHFQIEDCTLARWGDRGSGIDMVGCRDGTISGCRLEHRSELKANGIQAKGGSERIAIRRCRFENAGRRSVSLGGVTELQYFRPKDPRYEAKDITVEDCTFVGSSAPICFAGVDGAVVRFNTIYRPTEYTVRIVQESRGKHFVPCRNGIFRNNLVAFRADETRGIVFVGGGTAPGSFEFSNNHWYCIDRPERSGRLSLPVEEWDGVYGSNPRFVDAKKGDLSLRETSPVRDAGVRKLTR